MNILFVFAHPDDEAYGPAGTIAKLAKDHNVTVLSLCKGDRPGTEHVSTARSDAFVESCKTLGARAIICEFSDCRLEYAETLLEIEHTINITQPDIVYTHSISDIHKDHRLVAECTMVAARPKVGSHVKELYFTEMPASTAWSFNQIEPAFKPNVYEDISDFIELKKTVLNLYSTEVYSFPDARSVKAVEVLAEQRGYQSGFNFAEAFQLVFSRRHSN